MFEAVMVTAPLIGGNLGTDSPNELAIRPLVYHEVQQWRDGIGARTSQLQITLHHLLGNSRFIPA